MEEEKCFLPGRASFLSFLAKGSRKNKCQHLCGSQMEFLRSTTGMDTHRAVYIWRLTNLTGLRYLGEIQEEALLN